MSLELQIILVITLVAYTCLIPGCFLVLKKIAMLSDAISHSVILGIVLAYLWTLDLHSYSLFIGATLSGVVVVLITQWIISTKLVKREAVIALVFPGIFSLAIILIKIYAEQVHLDEDVVITGELAFTPLVTYKLSNTLAVPKALVVSGINFLINLTLLLLFYKELKLSSLDESYASTLGFGKKRINYSLTLITSLSAVTSFEAVGSILVIGFFILPVSISLIWTKQLKHVLALSFGVVTFSIVFSYLLSFTLNLSVAGTILIVMGSILLISILLNPRRKVV